MRHHAQQEKVCPWVNKNKKKAAKKHSLSLQIK